MTWKNLPIPETIVIPLVIGIVIDVFFTQPLFPSKIFWIVLALILLILGLILMIWSVREAGLLDMVSPGKLITSGPYSISRNPMYLSWISIYLSVFFLNRSLWLMLLFFVAILLTHYLAILREERSLREKFGDIFIEYCKRVRRYI
jgi:protein-S-isoprenylcysteine O-methyltransferase Ste14